MKDFKYFKPSEFQWCNPPCRIEMMDESFLSRLDEAREIAGCPFQLNSAFRTLEYEIKHGRSGTSSHTRGLAVDISALTPIFRYKILSALFAVGFTRIGIYPNWIHVDADLDKDPAVWYGK